MIGDLRYLLCYHFADDYRESEFLKAVRKIDRNMQKITFHAVCIFYKHGARELYEELAPLLTENDELFVQHMDMNCHPVSYDLHTFLNNGH